VTGDGAESARVAWSAVVSVELAPPVARPALTIELMLLLQEVYSVKATARRASSRPTSGSPSTRAAARRLVPTRSPVTTRTSSPLTPTVCSKANPTDQFMAVAAWSF
jgi:hypothetical protein